MKPYNNESNEKFNKKKVSVNQSYAKWKYL